MTRVALTSAFDKLPDATRRALSKNRSEIELCIFLECEWKTFHTTFASAADDDEDDGDNGDGRDESDDGGGGDDDDSDVEIVVTVGGRKRHSNGRLTPPRLKYFSFHDPQVGSQCALHALNNVLGEVWVLVRKSTTSNLNKHYLATCPREFVRRGRF